MVDSVAGDQDWQQEDGRKDQTLKYPLLDRGLHQRGVEHQHISVDHDADSEEPGGDLLAMFDHVAC